MQRDPARLADETFDLAVIGGGIYGATLAWEAASRGLSVALVEKGDFASATSANSLKTIHGGFRYLQHADFRRMRQSMHERWVLMQIAPHLVHPLPVLVPVYGHGMKGREALSLALRMNDALSYDRNWPASFRPRLDPQKEIPAGKMLSVQDTLRVLPGLPAKKLSGGAVFYDAQVYNSERLVLAYLQAAAGAGAALLNYAEARGFLRQGLKIAGLQVEDRIAGVEFELRARQVVNTAGPWIGSLLAGLPGQPPTPTLVKAVNLVTRPLFEHYAVGLMGSNGYGDSRALVQKARSLLFISPWRGRSLVGTSYAPYSGSPDDLKIETADVDDLIAALNCAYPVANLRRSEVSFVHIGLLPARRADPASASVDLESHYTLDGHDEAGLQGLLSVTGVKYTTARQVAQAAVDAILARQGRRAAPSISAATPLPGGAIDDLETYIQAETRRAVCGLGEADLRSLIYNHGAAYEEVLRHFDETPGGGSLSKELALLRTQVLHAVREEMAQTLEDVILRRTGLGSAEHPGEVTLRFCAKVMAAELGWTPERVSQEIRALERVYVF